MIERLGLAERHHLRASIEAAVLAEAAEALPTGPAREAEGRRRMRRVLTTVRREAKEKAPAAQSPCEEGAAAVIRVGEELVRAVYRLLKLFGIIGPDGRAGIIGPDGRAA